MRSVSFVLTPARGHLDPCEVAFRRNGVTPRYVHNFDVLDDDSVVLSYEVDGSRGAVCDALRTAGDDLIDYEVVTVSDTCVLRFHYRPCDLVSTLLDVHKSYPTLFDFPLVYLPGERTRLRHDLVGSATDVGDQIAETRDRVDVTVHRLGEYDPAMDHLFGELTARQREVLETAVDAGYYEIPREATHDDLAAELDCTASTVGRHLRRIEAAFASQVARTDGSSESSEEPAD